MRPGLRLLVPTALLLSACSTPSAAEPVTWTGSVTTLTPVLCIGRHGATGDCFTGGTTTQLTTLQLGECVSVTFAPLRLEVEGPQELTEVHPTSPAGHEEDCPPAP